MGSAPVRRTGPGGVKVTQPADKQRPADKPAAPHFAGMGQRGASPPALIPARPAPVPALEPEQPAEDEYPFATPGPRTAPAEGGYGFDVGGLAADIGGHLKPIVLTQSLRWHAQALSRVLDLSDLDVRDCLLAVLEDYPGTDPQG